MSYSPLSWTGQAQYPRRILFATTLRVEFLAPCWRRLRPPYLCRSSIPTKSRRPISCQHEYRGKSQREGHAGGSNQPLLSSIFFGLSGWPKSLSDALMKSPFYDCRRPGKRRYLFRFSSHLFILSKILTRCLNSSISSSRPDNCFCVTTVPPPVVMNGTAAQPGSKKMKAITAGFKAILSNEGHHTTG